jgi:5'-methylthioinosine phosphorylase
MLAIIGGSGLTQLANLDIARHEVVRTPYGEPSGPLTFGSVAGSPLIFLARHGYGHTIPPHRVNYRANIWALREVGASGVVSVASVGGIRADCVPGRLIVPHQIIDYTHSRASTFHDGIDCSVIHVDLTHPYDHTSRAKLLRAGELVDEALIDGAVYAATQGPRLETSAEIDRLERDGADIVGMTGMPEAALAREAGLPYVAIAVVANFAAGRGTSGAAIQFEDIERTLLLAMVRVRRLIEAYCRLQ